MNIESIVSDSEETLKSLSYFCFKRKHRLFKDRR